jgi:hypothetical protein
MRRFRWCSEDPSHYNPPTQEVCGLCGAPFVLPDESLEGLIRRCPLCQHQNLIHGDRCGLHGVCERCGHLLAVCSQDGTLIRADSSTPDCPTCGRSYVIPAPDIWGQVGAGPSRTGSSPEKLFAEVDRLVPAWQSWLSFLNPATGEPYSVAPPVLGRGLCFLQDGNRTLQVVELGTGTPLYPAYTAFSEGSPCGGPAVAGEYFYAAGPPGRAAVYSVNRAGREDVPPGQEPLPDYGMDLPRQKGELWDAFRPPTVNEVAGRALFLWRTVRAPHRYRLTATTLDLAQRLPEPGGDDFSDGPWQWDFELNAQPLGQPILTDGGTALVLLDPDRVLKIDAQGEPSEARVPSHIRDGALYAADYDLLVVNTVEGGLFALKADSLEEAWRRRSGSGVELVGPGCFVPGRSADEEGEIWTVDLDGVAEAIRVRDGVRASGFPKLESISQVTAPPSVCGDALLVPMGYDLILARRSGSTSILLATVPTAHGPIAYQAAVGHERVVLATERGKVMAYRVPERGAA